MILAIDIGNSNVVIGMWDKDSWQHIWRLETIRDDETGIYYTSAIIDIFMETDMDIELISGIIISSVVPDLNNTIELVVQQIFKRKAHWVDQGVLHKLELNIDRPSELGADLVANAMAASQLYRGNCIVVDFGTALTVTTITEDSKLLGVAIAPGLNTAIKALYGNTAQLPEVPLEIPDSVIGKNTEHAIQAGVMVGYFGMVKELIEKTKDEAGVQCKVIATGGISPVIKMFYPLFDIINPNLTLDGLRIIFEEMQS